MLAAHPLELAPLAQALDAHPHLARRVTIATVGVGIASAGAGTARVLCAREPSRVLLLGSAGVYPERFAFEPGELVAADRISLVDAACVAGRAQTPPAMCTSTTTSPEFTASLCAAAGIARRVAIANTASITTEDALAHELAAQAHDVENLEALPVALACDAAAIPFAALFGITNEVGARGRSQWQAHHERAAQACADALLAWLRTTQ